MQREPIKNWSASHCLHRRADSWSMFNRRLDPWGWSVVREWKKFEHAMTCGLQRAKSRDTTFHSSDNVSPTHARKWWGVKHKHCSSNAMAFESCSMNLLRIDELRILHGRANRDDRLLKIDFDPRGELQDRPDVQSTTMSRRSNVHSKFVKIAMSIHAVGIVENKQCIQRADGWWRWVLGNVAKRDGSVLIQKIDPCTSSRLISWKQHLVIWASLDQYMCEKQHINTIKQRVYAVNVVLYDQCMLASGFRSVSSRLPSCEIKMKVSSNTVLSAAQKWSIVSSAW